MILSEFLHKEPAVLSLFENQANVNFNIFVMPR